MTQARVIIAEDDESMQHVLRRIVEANFDVAAVVADGLELIAAVERERPDVVLLDIAMPGMNGIAAARRLLRIDGHPKIIFVTAHAHQDYVDEAFRLGAHGYVLKGQVNTELTTAIRQVLAGGMFRSARIA